MHTGTVNRFNNIKGYGFITADQDESEVFVHFSNIEMDGHKELKIGQRVNYDLSHGDKGPYATNVHNIVE